MMTAESPKIEFAVGSEVSPGRFFKSTFARNVVTCRDTRSLDCEVLVNGTAVEHDPSDARNNNFSSLVNFMNFDNPMRAAALRKSTNAEAMQPDAKELEKLRKQCQALKDENRRLQNALLQNVFLQARVDTLQRQLKQVESNQHMYRSSMEQVSHFLDRARKSLDILHSKNNLREKGRAPRSRSVHAVHPIASSKSAKQDTAKSSSASTPGSSRFTRTISVSQISSATSSIREFTWSVLRRNDPVHCTPPRAKPQDLKKKQDDGTLYQMPKQAELNPDEISPEKLSQEAYTLMRSVQSLLAMRQPGLERVSAENAGSCPSPGSDREITQYDSLRSGNFVNSTPMQERGYANGDRRNGSSSSDGDSGSYASSYTKSCGVVEMNRSLQNYVTGVKRSLDGATAASACGRTTEERNVVSLSASMNATTITEQERMFVGVTSSTPNQAVAKVEKKEPKEQACKSKGSASVSSAGDESGFSSMTSFQEIGLPSALPLPSVKGCHTEVGLPDVPLDKSRHRRWSSTPAEIQALFRQYHRASFGGLQVTTDSTSVWV